MRQKILLTSGDPNSVNSELIFKCWKKISKKVKKRIFLISNYKLLKEQYKKLNYKIKLRKVTDFKDTKYWNELKILNIDINFKDPFKVKQNEASKFILNSLNLAHDLALKKDFKGMINCPIDKKLLNKNKIGVTEFLASKCFIKDDTEAMIIYNEKLIVSPLTTHIDLKSVSKKISKNLLIKKVLTINNWFKKVKNINPKIAVLGLNPHNAEFRKNSEENKKIIPGIIKLKKMGISINGPLAADTIFIKDYKNFDIIIGMYHDQVLIPFKTLFKFDAINITAGLKYIRVSPDHGIATDKILQKKANPKSLLRCIKYIT